MTSSSRPDIRILGSLRSADGAGVVRIEDDFDTDIDDLWSALIDPDRLVRWLGQVDGDLRLGGTFRLDLGPDGDRDGRVDACEPPQRLLVILRETAESWQKGQGAPPFDEVVEARLTSNGSRTTLVVEARGMALDKIAFYGAGWQIHAENLATYLAERDRGDTDARFDELVASYQNLAANLT